MQDILYLPDITAGYCGLTEISGAHLLEGCIAALWLHKHESNLTLTILGEEKLTLRIVYPEDKKTQQLANCWEDKNVATEHGAACIGILLALRFTEYEVIKRAVRLEGIDYWIGDSKNGILFQKKARLEVSGIFKGTISDVEKRFNLKRKQTNQSDMSQLPAYISITEFSGPLCKFQQK